MIIQESIFWNLIRILWQKKYIFIISIISASIITFILTSLMPKTYKANLRFMVNEEDSGFNVSSLISDLPFNIGGFGSTDVNRYLALLNSRTIKDTLIKEFNLWEEYNAEYIEQVYKALAKNVEFIDNMDGTITVNCYFKREPEKAAQMAQRVYDVLYEFSLKLKKEEATNYRKYMEKNLKISMDKLTLLEDSLKTFQIKYKIIKFEEQVELSFNALAELETQNMYYKIERDILDNYLAGFNPKQKEIEQRLAAIRKNKEKLYKTGENYILALDKMPEYGIVYFRLYRDISIQQEIVKILLPLVENAKIEEEKRTVNIQLVDPPYIPQYKVKPKRLYYMIIVSLIIGILELLYFAILYAYTKDKTEIKKWINQK